METEQIKQHLVEVSKLMYSKGMVNAFEGNVSYKEGQRIFITPSGICKGFLTCDMLVVTDLEGNVVSGNNKPSSEIKLHLAAYRMRPDIKSLVHAHTPYATAFALANKPIETRAYPELIALFGSIPIAEYGTPSTDEIYFGMEGLIQDHDIILLANHGITAIGKDSYDAFFKLEAAESIAKTLFLTRLLGGEKELPANKLDELYQMRRKSR